MRDIDYEKLFMGILIFWSIFIICISVFAGNGVHMKFRDKNIIGKAKDHTTKLKGHMPHKNYALSGSRKKSNKPSLR